MKFYRVPELAKKYVEYDMIKAHTELPNFPDPRVRLLYTFLKVQKPEDERALETSALATFLVQLAMDTHDLIDPEPERKEEKQMRSRQMKVLAGDYFSGTFYELLAKAGQVDMIALLASAVCEVNRLKAGFYSRMKRMLLSRDEYLKESSQVKMGLFHFFTPMLDKAVQNLWRYLLSEISRCEVLAEEIRKSGGIPEEYRGYAYLSIMETGTAEDKQLLAKSRVSEREWSALLVKYNVKEQLASKLHHSVARVQELLQEGAGEWMQRELSGILEPFSALLGKSRSALNEG
ncbi:heptaprenyl diphosphate synthase [Paenibacillus sp. CAA11]|uniref:heptaprenyl diphosphate synthase component 1 n=1 Tax=Paenibacillus sp. CAA11 TaxID=1532905 RepID=UPI000D346395|nr:heptaprenyl diphosphate synthase component 1 [Paenibacillus sp. CAA11]AWB45016.1 heptaprenyl diphosphate synthase [Paenibacillus sp. CAA11]